MDVWPPLPLSVPEIIQNMPLPEDTPKEKPDIDGTSDDYLYNEKIVQSFFGRAHLLTVQLARRLAHHLPMTFIGLVYSQIWDADRLPSRRRVGLFPIA